LKENEEEECIRMAAVGCIFLASKLQREKNKRPFFCGGGGVTPALSKRIMPYLLA
jgi:hypothetical protein